MIALRAYYLFLFVSIGALLPLLALTLEARGFTPSEYAWIVTLVPLCRIVAPPLWGAVADRWTGRAALLRFNALGAGVAMVLLARPSGFTFSFFAFALWAVFGTGLMPIADASAHAALGARSADFGLVRVYGSYGFALAATGLALFGVGAQQEWVFIVAAAGYLGAFVLGHWLPDPGPSRGHAVLAGLRQVAAQPGTLLLWVGSAFYAGAHGAFDVYFGPHVARLPGGGADLAGLAWAFGVLVEIPVLFLVPRLLRRYRSGSLLVFAALVAALRWFIMAGATATWQVWASQPLHAVTFGLWYMCFVHANQALAPEQLRATVQGAGSAAIAVGMLLSTLIGGYLFESHGGGLLFSLCGVGAGVSALLYGWRALGRFR